MGLAAGPDGLYFNTLYKDLNVTNPTERGAQVLRVRWVGPPKSENSRQMTLRYLVTRPRQLIPIAMSLIALAILILALAFGLGVSTTATKGLPRTRGSS